MDAEIESRIGDSVVKSSMSFTPEQLLKNYSDRCSETMWRLTEESISAVIPEGVHLRPWLRKHDVKINVQDIRNGIEHRVFLDGDCVAKIRYRDGVITSKIKMAR